MSLKLLFGPSVGAGVDVTSWLIADGNLQWTKSVDQNWTAQWYMKSINESGTSLITTLGGRPAVGQAFWITETLSSVTTVRFSGLIATILETAYQGGAGYTKGILQFQIQAAGWTTVCDHRVIVEVYDAGQTSLSVITDIYNQTIQADGITFADVDGFTLVPQPLTFNPTTVTDAFNQLRTLLQQQWWIDENKGFHFKELALAPNSGITIDNAHQNIMLQDGPTGPPQITTTTANYRNVQYELTTQPVGTQVRSQTIIIGATDGFFQVVDFPIDTAPTITLNAIGQTIYQFGVDAFGKAGWYWQQGSNTLQQGQQISPGAGVTMVVTYNALSQNFTTDTNATQVAARAAIEGTTGKWENIDQQANMPNASVAHSYGQGNLTNFGVIPQIVVFDTYVSGFDEAVGEYITFNYTLNGLSGKFIITDVAATHVPGMVAPSPASGGAVLYTVTCTNQMYTGNYVQWFLGLTTSLKTAIQAAASAVATANNSTGSPPVTPSAGTGIQSEIEGWSVGASDQSGAGALVLTSSLATVPVGRVNFQNSGALMRVSVSARIPPQGQNLVIDILRATAAQQTGSPPCATGSSIFPAGADSNKLVLPDSQCTVARQIVFNADHGASFTVTGMDQLNTASPPVAIVPDLYTLQAKYVATSGTVVNAQDVVVEMFIQF